MSKTSIQFNRQTSLTSTNSSSSQCEKDLKVDKRILEIMHSGGNNVFPSTEKFFGKICDQTNVKVSFSSTFRDRQGNEIPVVRVIANNMRNLEAASALIMEHLDPHRDKMTFNIDVPYNDHSYIIGKDGSRIKQLSRETGCHIHLPDCNKTSGKKSNKLSIAGTSFESIEQARNQIRKSLPLNIGFKAKIKSRKFVHIDTASSEVQAIKRKHRVDVTFTNVISNNKYPEVTINVKGGRSQLDEIKNAAQDLYQFVTGEDILSSKTIEFTITIDISHSHHQYVKGKNNCNLKVIHQRSKSTIVFPPVDSDSNQVLIQGSELLSTVMGWQELMGYLPLLLSFDVNFDIGKVYNDVQKLEKEHGVGIRTREKLTGHVYTVLIKTQERHSICLQEIRQRILDLKSKVDKVNDENRMVYDGNKVYNTMSHNYSFKSNFHSMNESKMVNYNTYCPPNASNYSSKVLRLGNSQPETFSLNQGRGNMWGRKHKGGSKHGTLSEHPMLNFHIQNTYLADNSLNELIPMNKSSPNVNNFNQTIIDSNFPMLNKTFESYKSTNDNILHSPIKANNSELNLNFPFDPTLKKLETTLQDSRPRSANWDSFILHSEDQSGPEFDYSFSRYTFQKFSSDDSGIGSSMLLSPGKGFPQVKDESFNNQDTSTNYQYVSHLANTLQPSSLQIVQN